MDKGELLLVAVKRVVININITIFFNTPNHGEKLLY